LSLQGIIRVFVLHHAYGYPLQKSVENFLSFRALSGCRVVPKAGT
jgi:hypothetical protein